MTQSLQPQAELIYFGIIIAGVVIALGIRSAGLAIGAALKIAIETAANDARWRCPRCSAKAGKDSTGAGE